MAERATRKVWMSPEIMEGWRSSRTVEGDLLTWEWGEPDADGFYEPRITRHPDDNLRAALLAELRERVAALLPPVEGTIRTMGGDERPARTHADFVDLFRAAVLDLLASQDAPASVTDDL